MKPTLKQRHAVYHLVRMAVAKGKLIRPNRCERCDCKPVLTSNGRSKIHAHHDDYAKPLKVKWLCASCHRTETPHLNGCGTPNYGEKNGKSKLTLKQVEAIRRADRPYGSAVQLAKKYGVGVGIIFRIRNRENWVGPK